MQHILIARVPSSISIGIVGVQIGLALVFDDLGNLECDYENRIVTLTNQVARKRADLYPSFTHP